MSFVHAAFSGRTPYVVTALVVAASLFSDTPTKPLRNSGGCFRASAVGGVMVDASGAITRMPVDAVNKLSRERAEALKQIAGDMKQPSAMRKVSLKQLEKALEKNLNDGEPIPDEMRLLAGLQNIQYVFVYPERQDIVLAGFGEGWKVTERGDVVGLTTGKPVLLLDDLLVALRYAEQSANGGISCSIDPTPEGLRRLQEHVKTLTTIGNPQQTGRGIEQVLGPQMVSISGVPATTHFAHVMVAADYRMKRLGMNLDESKVAGFTSYLQMLSGSGRGMSAVAPRWWLVPDYQPVVTDSAGLAFELRGGSVKCLTEDTVFAAGGGKQQAGVSSPAAQRWADMMTSKYEALAAKEPVFAELKNVMDMAVVGALIVKENLAQKAGYSMPLLMNAKDLPNDELEAVKKTDSVASLLKKGNNWVISASGGVQIQPFAVVAKTEMNDSVAKAKPEMAASNNWWWD